jgi:heme A synthase
MLELQVQLLSLWWAAQDSTRRRLHDARYDDRGEVTATTAIIVILVVAAIAAGGVIAAKVVANANSVPDP